MPPLIEIKQKGDFRHTEGLINRVLRINPRSVLEKYGRKGVAALQDATPVDTGLTAASWSYDIQQDSSGYSISWSNSNTVSGVPIVILLQYGHGTRGGAYVQGTDFINPALKPIFDSLAQELWKEVTG